MPAPRPAAVAYHGKVASAARPRAAPGRPLRAIDQHSGGNAYPAHLRSEREVFTKRQVPVETIVVGDQTDPAVQGDVAAGKTAEPTHLAAVRPGALPLRGVSVSYPVILVADEPTGNLDTELEGRAGDFARPQPEAGSDGPHDYAQSRSRA